MEKFHMTKFLKVICLSVSLILCSLAYAEIRVTATGQAAGKGKIVKQQALADALREAVRKGAGVNIISSTKVTDYVLDFDRIFSRAFGYVKTFTVLSKGYDKTGIYKVKISALVSKTSPGMNDYMAMRQVIAMKGSPRLLIRASGEINNIGDARKLIDGQLREIALKCGFQTIKISQFDESEANRIKRDRFLGKNESTAYRESGIRGNYDFVINVDVSGAYNGKSELYGISTQRFSLGADLGATYPSGNSIAQITIPSKEIDIAQVTDKTQAARSALQKTLGGDKGKNFRALLVRVLASWVSEFDTGLKITVEFPKISSELFKKIVSRLKNCKGINAIHVREFDERLKSIIEVESNLKAYDLAKLIGLLSDNQLKTDRATNDYIQMGTGDTYSASDMIVILIGAIVIFILLLLIVKNMKSKNKSKK
jgi:hypothetical protein